jgi:hypothetical protein
MQDEDSPSERLEDRLERARAVPVAISVAPCAVSAVTASRFLDVQISKCTRTRERRQSVQQMRVEAKREQTGIDRACGATREATRWAVHGQYEHIRVVSRGERERRWRADAWGEHGSEVDDA